MTKFPKNFNWGISTSAYQTEGGWQEGDKGMSIWDEFVHIPGKIKNGDTGDTACDHFHNYETDIQLLKSLGVNSYRFSISWPRIMTAGFGKINQQGINFYSRIIDLLIENDIEPWVTLHHWDLPLALQKEKNGWLNADSADYFKDFAAVCFDEFGSRVKNWITLNEPWVIAIFGYGKGIFPPARQSDSEPYQVAHNLLRAHGKAANLYHRVYQPQHKGRISLCNNCDWREPLTDSQQDRAAAQRSLEFYLGWFADPLYLGDYPHSMRRNVGDRLPTFTDNERELIMGSCDFFGLNHYTTMYAEDAAGKEIQNEPHANSGLEQDERVILTSDASWQKTEMGWNVVPWGLPTLLKWIDNRYNKPEIVVTENGCAFNDQVENGRVRDQQRIDFLTSYIRECRKAMDQGVKVTGYFIWSLLDNFEWDLGYSKRFGLYYVDFKTLERIPKDSARWYKQFIQNIRN